MGVESKGPASFHLVAEKSLGPSTGEAKGTSSPAKTSGALHPSVTHDPEIVRSASAKMAMLKPMIARSTFLDLGSFNVVRFRVEMCDKRVLQVRHTFHIANRSVEDQKLL
jgi:hypothetical protein